MMPLWLLTGMTGLRKAAGALWRLIVRYPWQVAVVALLCISAWLWTGWNGALADLNACTTGREADRKAYADAQKEAAAKALAAKAAAERRYLSLAEKADDDLEQARADAMDAAERYIAAHRVRPESAGGSPGGPAAAPESGVAGIPAGMPPDGFVAVSDADVRACSAATAYAVMAHNWAKGL